MDRRGNQRALRATIFVQRSKKERRHKIVRTHAKRCKRLEGIRTLLHTNLEKFHFFGVEGRGKREIFLDGKANENCILV